VTGPVFRFRLERVRAVRERREILAKQELANAISRLMSTQEGLRVADEHLEHARGHQREVAGEPATVSAAELFARQAFIERAEAQRAAQALELSRRESEVLERDAELTSAAGEHEMLKRLKERHRGEHVREADRRERNTLDEIATIRFRRSPA
jgi:flagellar export protein FliJ